MARGALVALIEQPAGSSLVARERGRRGDLGRYEVACQDFRLIDRDCEPRHRGGQRRPEIARCEQKISNPSTTVELPNRRERWHLAQADDVASPAVEHLDRGVK